MPCRSRHALLDTGGVHFPPAPVVAVVVVARLLEAGNLLQMCLSQTGGQVICCRCAYVKLGVGDLLHIRLPVYVEVGQGDHGDQGDKGLQEQEDGGSGGAVLWLKHPGHEDGPGGQEVEELLQDWRGEELW